jgi:hypothetical protein
MKHLSHYGDILAIPFFALLIFYFHRIEQKTELEMILFLFSIAGFILDLFFTFLFINIRRVHFP